MKISKTHHFFAGLLLLCSCVTSPSILAQTTEQLSQLRQQVSQSNNSGTTSTPNVSPLNVNSQRTLPDNGGDVNTMGQFSTQPRNGVSLPGEPTINTVFPAQEPMQNPPFAANLFIGGFESD